MKQTTKKYLKWAVVCYGLATLFVLYVLISLICSWRDFENVHPIFTVLAFALPVTALVLIIWLGLIKHYKSIKKDL